jgi:D-xylose transport system permease protein
VTTVPAHVEEATPADDYSLAAIARRRWEALKAGDVGSLPIVIGLALIVAFFYSKNENFLTAGNFTNLMTQMAGVTTIAIGVVFVLLLGEIDLAAIGTALFALSTLAGVVSRRRHGIGTDNLVIVAAKLVFVGAVLFGAVIWANKERGFPLAFVLVIILLVFWTWVAERTTFGRHIYAVGGNDEAARRAGINVARIRLYVFMISGLMAGFGGVILAARLNSVDLNAGGGTLLLDAISAAVIGGTSLFGGRGRVISALLGALVISTVGNGIDLLGYSSAIKYMVTGAILLAAVTLDAVSRRRLERAGR